MIGWAVLIGLASYRLYRIPAEDSITRRPRDWLYAKSERGWVFLADLLSCAWCVGFWWAGALAGLVAWRSDLSLVDFALLWLASSTVAGITRAVYGRLSD